MENVYFQRDRRDIRASSCPAEPHRARRLENGNPTPRGGGDRLVHGVAKLDKGLVGVGEADEAQTGIFNLKRRIDR
jgi:hypothetical protein